MSKDVDWKKKAKEYQTRVLKLNIALNKLGKNSCWCDRERIVANHSSVCLEIQELLK